MYTQLQLDQLALDDYYRARRHALLRRIAAFILRKRNELLSLDTLLKRVHLIGQHSLGVQTVEIDRIVGTASRSREFDGAFLPRETSTMERWMNITKANYLGVNLPPVELRKVGSLYFVMDGHHRISVAREKGQKYIDAYVTEMKLAKVDPFDSVIIPA